MLITLPAFLQAILMGLVEGLTEFIPVSSTGHLLLFGHLIGFEAVPGKVFEVVIQFGAVLAIFFAYGKRLWRVVSGMMQGQKSAWIFTRNILLGFLPALVLGVLLHDFIKQVLFDERVVAWALLVGGIIILLVDKLPVRERYAAVEDMPAVFALKVGLCQAVAMIPGVSRSGATILGAWLLGARRRAAMEFSFFLAIPTMLGAATFDLYKNWSVLADQKNGFELISLGFISAFFAALLTVRWVLGFVERWGLTPFGWYRVAAGLMLLLILP